MSTGLHGYPIDFDQLHRSRQERSIRRSRKGARNQSRRSLALWRKR